APDADVPYRRGRAASPDADVYELASELGDTGTASPLFGLLAAWEDGAENVVVVGYGDGAGADALRLSGSLSGKDWQRDSGTVSISYTEYLRERGHIVSEEGGV
ncbi:MAG: ACP synthase, partial [Halobacteria archaeon]|nr:ACP synthase [Halobacteria archaeon]